MPRMMDLELSPPPRFVVSAWGLLLFIASLVLFAFIWQQYQAQQASHAAISRALNARTLSKAAPALPKANPVALADLKQVKAIVASLITPWQPLMQAVEQADMADIALLGIDPDIKKQQVLLTGEAKNLQTVLRYVAQLESQAVLHEVYLQKHAVEESDVSKPVRFAVLAKWKVNE